MLLPLLEGSSVNIHDLAGFVQDCLKHGHFSGTFHGQNLLLLFLLPLCGTLVKHFSSIAKHTMENLSWKFDGAAFFHAFGATTTYQQLLVCRYIATNDNNNSSSLGLGRWSKSFPNPWIMHTGPNWPKSETKITFFKMYHTDVMIFFPASLGVCQRCLGCAHRAHWR